MDKEQQHAFERALERKHEEAQRRARDNQPRAGDEERSEEQGQEAQLTGHDRPQDELSVRAKNTGHRKKTADKWNQ